MNVSNNSIIGALKWFTLRFWNTVAAVKLVCLTSFSMELESPIEDSDKSNALGCSLLPLVRLASLAKENLKSKVLGCYMPMVVLLVSWTNTEDGFAT